MSLNFCNWISLIFILKIESLALKYALMTIRLKVIRIFSSIWKECVYASAFDDTHNLEIQFLRNIYWSKINYKIARVS